MEKAIVFVVQATIVSGLLAQTPVKTKAKPTDGS